MPIKAEVVNAFVDPVVQVIKSCVGLDARLATLDVTTQIDPPPNLSVTIEMTGSLQGPVTFAFSEEVARRIAGQMLAIDDDGVDQATCNDAVAELANIVTGNATGKLLDAGYTVEIHPPRMRPDGEASPDLAVRTLAVTLVTTLGRIRVFIGVTATPPPAMVAQ